MNDVVYVLEVTLNEIQPAIWRRVRVPGSATLGQLHDILQRAFGWTDSHLHVFRIGRQVFGVPSPEDFEPLVDERSVRLDEVAAPRTAILYEYDFGDGWEHDIVVERIDRAEASDAPPVCLDGARACPPEDCGGPGGYEDLVGALRNRKHPRHAGVLDWVDPSWTPEAFDVDAVNAELRALDATWKRPATKRRPKAKAASRRKKA